jgi:hypothetical protein
MGPRIFLGDSFDLGLLAGAQTATIENGGHFLPLDRPPELQEVIVRFACLRRS